MVNSELQKRLRDLYTQVRDADRLVCSESETDIVKVQKSYTDFYVAVEDIRTTLGKILDDLDRGKFDTVSPE